MAVLLLVRTAISAVFWYAALRLLFVGVFGAEHRFDRTLFVVMGAACIANLIAGVVARKFTKRPYVFRYSKAGRERKVEERRCLATNLEALRLARARAATRRAASRR